MTDNLLLAVLATLTLMIANVRFGWRSLVALGVTGAYIYAIPAFIDRLMPFHQSLGKRGVFASVLPETVSALALAWLTLFALVAILPVPRLSHQNGAQTGDGLSTRHLRSCLVLTVAGYLFLARDQGALFFLQAREEIDGGLIQLLWRWTFVIGLLLAIQLRRWATATIFLLALSTYFLAGDRTILAITCASFLVRPLFSGNRRQVLPGPRYWFLGLMFAFLIIFGKLVYLAAKSGSATDLDYYFSVDALYFSALSFEPLATMNILQYTVLQETSMDLTSFVVSVMGNLLIVPSLFDVDTNYFNTLFTALMPPALGFGVAGNYFAHAYVAFGYLGIIAFAAMFILSLHWIERKAIRARGLLRPLLIIIGVTIGIYAHRNGLDNLLSFVRQIVIVGLGVWLLSAGQYVMLPQRRQMLTAAQ